MAVRIDDVDRKILAELQRDASQSLDEIAAKVGSSKTPVWNRIRKMREGGVIGQQTVMLDAVEGLSIDLIDDAFNANPASVAAALDVLAAVEPKQGQGRIATGRRIAILGDMLELGEDELNLHRALADHPAMAKIRRIDCVGPRMRALYDVLPVEKRRRCVDKAEELAAEAHKLVDAGDVVLCKGSKGSKVGHIVQAVKDLGQAHPMDEQRAD